MRITDLTEAQQDALILKCVARLRGHDHFIRWTRIKLVALLVTAGFCAGSALWAVPLASGRGLALVPSISGYSWLLFFGLASVLLLVSAWSRLMEHQLTMTAGDRAYLILVFEKCAQKNIEFSAEEVVAFLRRIPDSMSMTEGKVR